MDLRGLELRARHAVMVEPVSNPLVVDLAPTTRFSPSQLALMESQLLRYWQQHHATRAAYPSCHAAGGHAALRTVAMAGNLTSAMQAHSSIEERPGGTARADNLVSDFECLIIL